MEARLREHEVAAAAGDGELRDVVLIYFHRRLPCERLKAMAPPRAEVVAQHEERLDALAGSAEDVEGEGILRGVRWPMREIAADPQPHARAAR